MAHLAEKVQGVVESPPRGLVVMEQVAAEEDQVAILRSGRARMQGVRVRGGGGGADEERAPAGSRPHSATITFCFARSRVSSNAANESIPRIGSLSCGAEGAVVVGRSVVAVTRGARIDILVVAHKKTRAPNATSRC